MRHALARQEGPCAHCDPLALKPRRITEAGKAALQSGRFQMVRVNYANPGAARDRPQSP